MFYKIIKILKTSTGFKIPIALIIDKLKYLQLKHKNYNVSKKVFLGAT